MISPAFRARSAAVAVGASLVALALTGCGGSSAAGDAASSAAPAASAPGDSATLEASPSVAAEESSGTSEETTAGEAAELPDGWPAEVLVPAGDVVLATERGGGWDLLVEGIDEAELKGLIEQMTASGYTSPGITDMGSGAWIAELTGPVGIVDYAYETGGAGLPNVRIVVMPAG